MLRFLTRTLFPRNHLRTCQDAYRAAYVEMREADYTGDTRRIHAARKALKAALNALLAAEARANQSGINLRKMAGS